MSREAVRVAITSKVQELQAAWSNPDLATLVLEMPNGAQVDTASQQDPFLKLRIIYISGEQANLGPDSYNRQYGHILLEAWTKIGQGTKLANQLLEHFCHSIGKSDSAVYPARTFVPSFVADYEKLGWRVDPVVIPFFYDEKH